MKQVSIQSEDRKSTAQPRNIWSLSNKGKSLLKVAIAYKCSQIKLSVHPSRAMLEENFFYRVWLRQVEPLVCVLDT